MTKLSSNIYILPKYGNRINYLTPAEREVFRFICRKTRGNSLTRLTGSYVANALYRSRQFANRIMNRLQALGLIVRLRGGKVQVRLENLLNIKDRAAKVIRRKMTKPLKRLLNPKNVNPRFTKQKKDIIKPSYEAVPYSKEALANEYYRAKGQVAGNLSLADLLRMKKSSRT